MLANIGRAYPDTDKGRTARVMPLTMHVTGQDQRQALWIMAAGVVFVLLIACVDVAVMLLARGVSRQREMAIRTALGAGRVRIVRQILLENCVLGLVSALGGLLIAWGLTAGMSQFLSKSFQRGGDIHLNWAVFVAAFAIAIAVEPHLRNHSGEEAVVRRSHTFAEIRCERGNGARRLSSALRVRGY